MDHRPTPHAGLQRIPAPEAVIFDWDGTLAFGSLPDLRLAFDMPAHAQGLASRSVAIVRALPFSTSTERAVRSLFGIAPSPEAIATIQLLRRHGVPVGIVSNTSHGALMHEVPAALGEMADGIHIRGAQPEKRGKPFADGLVDILAEMGVSPSPHVWFVGDRYDMDVGAARQAGLSGVLIHPSRHAYDAMENDMGLHEPFFVVEGHRSLGQLLRQHLEPLAARGMA